MKLLEHFIKATNNKTSDGFRPLLRCNDGFSMSVQASKYHYCNPRKDNFDNYTHVEVWVSDDSDSLLNKYANEDGICSFISVDIINEIIKKHKGVQYFL